MWGVVDGEFVCPVAGAGGGGVVLAAVVDVECAEAFD